MKENIFIFIFISCLSIGKSQNKPILTNIISDSLGMISRFKSDIVLNHFDSIKEPKILYTLQNKDYYIIIKENNLFNEYYVAVDTLDNIQEIRLLNGSKKNKKLLSKYFNFSNYKSEFVTQSKGSQYIRGEPSYFVIKDKNNNRYGEYYLASLTLPVPIEVKLYGYLLRRLIEESTKKTPSCP
jgi:hypothetical protein